MDNEISVFTSAGGREKELPLASSNMAFSNSSFQTFFSHQSFFNLSIRPDQLICPPTCPDQQGLQSKYFARTTLFPPPDHYPPRSPTPAGLARIISRCHHDRYLGSGNAPFVRQGLPITPVIIFNFATFTAGK